MSDVPEPEPGEGAKKPARRRYAMMLLCGAVVIVVACATAAPIILLRGGRGGTAPKAQVSTSLSTTTTAGTLPAGAVVRVGNVYILEDQFDDRVAEFAEQYGVASEEEDPDGWADLEADVLDYLVTYEIVAQKAPQYGLSVTDEEIQAYLDGLITKDYGGEEKNLVDFLATKDLTVDDLKRDYRETVLVQRVQDKVTANATGPGQSVAQVKDNAWKQWLAEAKAELGVAYKAGMEPTTTTTTAAVGASRRDRGDPISA